MAQEIGLDPGRVLHRQRGQVPSPPNNRNPAPDGIRGLSSLPRGRQYALIGADVVVVTLGNFATQLLLDRTESGIGGNSAARSIP